MRSSWRDDVGRETTPLRSWLRLGLVEAAAGGRLRERAQVCGVAFLFVAAATALAASPDFAVEGKRWWSHVEMLASDGMEGRNTGSEGYRKAAMYVAQEFERSGLKPAGTKGYSQPMTFQVRQIDEAKSALALVRDGHVVPIALGDEAMIGLHNDLAASLEAPLVFAGHGLVIPDVQHDDLAGLDVKGKIVVFLTGGPESIPGPLKAHFSSAGERWTALQKAGAIGLVSIPNPKSISVPWSRAALARLQPAMSLADPKLNEDQGMRVSLTINPAKAENLFEGTGHTFAEILALADASKPLPRFAMKSSLRFQSAMKRWTVESQNLAGMVEGSDPVLKKEYMIFSAHLDHLGVGQPVEGDKIFNGAMDDASGIASLIEIARMLHDEKIKLRRSVLFLAVTGEEKGLQGSKFFANHPTVPLGSIVADINMDMFLPLFPLKLLEVQGATESTLGDDIKAACAKAGVEMQNDKEPDQNKFIRSDQYSFIRRGVPSLAFKFGYTKGTPEEKLFKEWYTKRYHAVSDDLQQPVDKAAAAQFNRILVSLGQIVANADQRPRWYESSFFKRFAGASQ